MWGRRSCKIIPHLMMRLFESATLECRPQGPHRVGVLLKSLTLLRDWVQVKWGGTKITSATLRAGGAVLAPFSPVSPSPVSQGGSPSSLRPGSCCRFRPGGPRLPDDPVPSPSGNRTTSLRLRSCCRLWIGGFAWGTSLSDGLNLN